MSIRAKAAFSVITIVVIITVADYFSSFFLTQKSLLDTMERELSLSLNIADDLVSTRIMLLISDAKNVAERLLAANDDELEQTMREQLFDYNEFRAFTIFGRDGILSSYGYTPIPFHLLNEGTYLQNAFEGTSVISSTHYYEETAELEMHICVQMDGERVLAVTIPGMLFSMIVEKYRLWETGNIFILDDEGTMIGNYRDYMVLGRYHFVELGRMAIDDDTIEAFYEKMKSADEGSGKYYFNGIERFCAFKRVSASDSGWIIAVATPLRESPANSVKENLLRSSLLFLVAGIVIAIFVSGSIARPFHQIEEQKTQLEEMNEAVNAASDAKSNFLANMSHEMRTPLNAIIGLSDLSIGLNRSSAPRDDVEGNLKKIYSSGMTLLGTVNDILDISKIESGKFELVPVEYNMPSLINDAVTQNIVRIGEKPIELKLNIDENLPSLLIGDELRIRQVISNLLSNAIKYTKEGIVELRISCETVKDAADTEPVVWMTASVKDSGIGIRKEDIGKLFSTYNQVDTKANHKIEGTGLGLAITKQLVELMQGTIIIESEYGKGTTFRIRIKQGFVSNERIGSSVVEGLKNFQYTDDKQKLNAEFKRINLSYAKVLVVDDVSVNLDVAKGMMQPYGMQIDCVGSGQDAIDLIREGVKYDAVFMDHMMPGIDGMEATRIIRNEINTDYARTVPIIALTANAIRGNEEIFLKNGFEAFISKPIDLKELDNVLRQWVRDKEKEKLIQDEPKEHVEKPVTQLDNVYIEGMDLKNFVDRYQKEKIIFDILRSYAQNTPPLLELMTKNLAAGNLSSYEITVHGIKGSSRGIFAANVGNKAEELEHAANSGDINFVKSNHEVFLATTQKLIAGIDAVLKERFAEMKKPVKDAPDAGVLTKLKEAAMDYDMDSLDKAITELDEYEYGNQQELVNWLKEQASLLNFRQIADKL